MKRFTDTEKWSDPWFRRLSPELKCFWSFVLDNCDPSGVWKVDMEFANFCIGGSLNEETVLSLMPGRFKPIEHGKWFVPKFIRFQYGELKTDCRPHQSVIRFLEEHGLKKEYEKSIHRVSKGNGYPARQEKDKNKTSLEETEKPFLNRVRVLFHKRPATPLDKSESSAWETAKNTVEETTEEEWQLLEWAYSQTTGDASKWRRKDMATLLNNFRCEIDRAREWKRNGQPEASKIRMLN